MNEVVPPLPKIKRPSKGWMRLAGTISIFGVLGISWGIFIAILSSRETRLRQECIANKEPLKLTQLNELYRAGKSATNAAAEYLHLWAEDDPVFWKAYAEGLNSDENPKDDIPQEIVSMTDWRKQENQTEDKWKSLYEYLGSQEKRRPQLLAATAKPECRFSLDFTRLYDRGNQHLRALRLEARRLSLDALAATRSNQTARAVADIEATSSISRHISSEPSSISQLTSVAILAMSVRNTECLLSQRALNDDEIKRIKRSLDWYSPEHALHLSIISERSSILSFYDLNKEEMDERFSSQASSAEETVNIRQGYRMMMVVAKVSGGKQADCINILTAFRAAEDLLKSPSATNHQSWSSIFRKSGGKFGFPPKFFSKTMLPALDRILTVHQRIETQKRLALTSLAIEQYRLNTGHLPDKLENLDTLIKLADTTDPFSGQPFHFQKLASGYRLYSFGMDGKDSGGKRIGSIGMVGEDGDIVFEINR